MDAGEQAMDEVEFMNAIRQVAKSTRVLYETLIAEGFSEANALELAGRYLHGTAGGKVA